MACTGYGLNISNYVAVEQSQFHGLTVALYILYTVRIYE